MADQNRDRLLDHSYDDIQEYDNPMPRWWVIIFWITIVFAVLYALNVPGIGTGQGRVADYEADVARAQLARQQMEPAGGPSTEELAALASQPAALAEGKQVFVTYCAACHREDGGGLIGPNLTDDPWIHGGQVADIRRTIDQGVLEKGMPNWGKVLRP
ncbi:MAG TPA: cbb3-type cytochrome c oxidase N-terminal domain-containing protein, partial [Gemmatimonadaceae bacterium]